VIDQSKLGLPSWFVPSARGVAIASNVLLRGALYNWASTSARSQRSDSFIIQSSASCSDSKPLTYCIRPLTHWMKTRQPSPAGERGQPICQSHKRKPIGEIGSKSWSGGTAKTVLCHLAMHKFERLDSRPLS
jgi:hypothetical protein